MIHSYIQIPHNETLNDIWYMTDDLKHFTHIPESNIHPLIDNFSEVMDNFNTQLSFFDEIAVEIVTESVFSYPHIYITEKIIRSIVNKKIFIYVGPPFTLQFLKNKGFKTFSPFINETYDFITDENKRLNLIIEEIKKIANLPLESIKKYILNYSSILDYNFNHFMNLKNTEIAELENTIAIIKND